MKVWCSRCRKELKIDYNIETNDTLYIEYIHFFGICNHCKARIGCVIAIDSKTGKVKKTLVDTDSADYIG